MFMKFTPADAARSAADAKTIQDAVASFEVESWMQSLPAVQASSTVSANERASLTALIAYVAHRSGEHEFGVARRLADRFNIPNVNFLPAQEFDRAIRYLVDGMAVSC